MADRTTPATDEAGTEIGYGAALAELEQILEEIEDDAVDVDVLATKVRRAAELLRVCRARIASASVEVTQIVADLEPSPLDGAGDARDTAE
ncbi:MAG: exodeoxyribonuclease VII small subunit [Microthrixaceae bacterium]